ncbi:2OG-Fe dioxygenase family protein [Xanthomonadaceae bacterium JHOS43]|nr:2OG-Fe dioxygenase family protein [Xanthomonadaceae bacterium JHOS43]
MDDSQPLAQALEAELERQGFAFVDAERMRGWLHSAGSLADWSEFARSWDDLHLDTYMADGGRYRRRRFAVFASPRDGALTLRPNLPHWQSRDYNRLNGGIARWFEPITHEVIAGPALGTVLYWFRHVCNDLRPEVDGWHIEVHQFRIEAGAQHPGQPTPEGMHRDGVDFVLVLMIGRDNIREGTTSIHALDGTELGSFTLTHPFDAAIVEDARVFHGVTAVEPIDPARPAARDVLVVTFRRQAVA